MLEAKRWNWGWWAALALSALVIALMSCMGARGPTWDDYLLLEDFKAHGMPSFNLSFDAISKSYHRPLGQWAIYAPLWLGLDFATDAKLGGVLIFLACFLCGGLSSSRSGDKAWTLLLCVFGLCASQAIAEPWIWMSARFDMLMAIWGLCFAWLGAKSASPPWVAGLMAMALAIAAGLCKETAAALVPFWALAWCAWLWVGGQKAKAGSMGVGAVAGVAIWLLLLRAHGDGVQVIRGFSDSVAMASQSSARMWLLIAGLPLELAPSPQTWGGGLAWVAPSFAFLLACGWGFKRAFSQRCLGWFLLSLGLSHAFALCWASALMNPETSFVYSIRGIAPGATLAIAGAVRLAWGNPKRLALLLAWFCMGIAPAAMQRQAWSSDMDLWRAQLRWAEPTTISTLNFSSALYDAQRFEPALAMSSLSERIARNERSGCKAATIGALSSFGLSQAPPAWVWAWEQRSWCSVVLSMELARLAAGCGECARALAIYQMQWAKGQEASVRVLGPIAPRWGDDWVKLEGACGSPDGKAFAEQVAARLGSAGH